MHWPIESSRRSRAFPITFITSSISSTSWPAASGVDDVSAAVDTIVYADFDPANMIWHAERIPLYYEPEQATLAFAILGVLARADAAVPRQDLVNLVLHELPEASERDIFETCALLRRDHYITLRSSDGALQFRWALVKRWWKANR